MKEPGLPSVYIEQSSFWYLCYAEFF